MRTTMMTVAVVAALISFSGCSSHQIDREAWGKDLQAQGITVKDWEKLETTTTKLCGDDDSQLDMDVAVFKDRGSLKELETGFRYVCPDHMDAFNAAVQKMTQTDAEFDVICRTPKSDRTQEQQDMAEAVGC